MSRNSHQPALLSALLIVTIIDSLSSTEKHDRNVALFLSSILTKKRKKLENHFSLTIIKGNFSNGIIIWHPFSTSDDQLVWLKIEELWDIIEDSAIEHIFWSIATPDKYILTICYFCNYFQLIVYCLSIKELSNIRRTTIPPFFSTYLKAKQNIITKTLEIK